MVVHFPDGILGSILVGKSEGYLRSLAGIGSVEGEQIGTERIHDEARVLRDKICSGIGHADGAVTGGKHRAPVAAASRDGRRCRGVSRKRVSNSIALRLKATKIKELVLDDVPAGCAPELFQFHGRFCLQLAVRTEMVEEIAGVKRIRAAKSIRAAVYLVRSSFQADAGDGASLPSKLRLRIDL